MKLELKLLLKFFELHFPINYTQIHRQVTVPFRVQYIYTNRFGDEK